MKKRISVLIVLLVMLLSLSACGGKKNEPEEVKPKFDLAGKTYYNTVDEYGHEDHAKVWFGKDGSFVLNDSYGDGYYEATGTWALNEDVCTLTVEKTGAGSFGKILFEVRDNDTLILKTTLAGSKSDHTFSINEIKGSTANVTPDDKKEDEKKEEEKKEETTVKEIPCTGITSLYHNYWMTEGSKNWDLEIRPVPADTTDKITFKSNDENVVKIDEQGRASAIKPGKTTIDVVCGDQKLTVNFETRAKGATGSASTWKSTIKDVDERFLPTLYLDGAGNFVLTENCYAGMGQFKGTYKVDGEYYILTVTDNTTMQGFAGGDVKEIRFKVKGEKSLKLKTDLCMSMSGDYFDLVP